MSAEGRDSTSQMNVALWSSSTSTVSNKVSIRGARKRAAVQNSHATVVKSSTLGIRFFFPWHILCNIICWDFSQDEVIESHFADTLSNTSFIIGSENDSSGERKRESKTGSAFRYLFLVWRNILRRTPRQTRTVVGACGMKSHPRLSDRRRQVCIFKLCTNSWEDGNVMRRWN